MIEPEFTPPTVQIMQDRIAVLTAAMARDGLDYLVAIDPDNVFYLTNFANYVHERPFIVVVDKSGNLSFVAPKLEVPHVEARKVGPMQLVTYFEFPAPATEGWDDRLGDVIAPDSIVGVEATCPLFLFEAIRGTTVKSDIIEDSRMIKTDYEIARITYASNIANGAMRHVLDNAAVGQSLIDVGSQVRAIMLMNALGDYPDTNMLATNVTGVFQPPSVSHDPHNFTNVNMAMEEGGPHVMLINGTINGYGTEVERTFFLGHVPDEAKRPYEVMMAARHLCFELLKPGANLGAVDKAVNDLMRQAGYGDALLHRTGHSIGVTGHEGPFIAEGYDRVVEPGMIFTVEPGIYLPGIGGFRHSDTVVITKDGAQSLTPVAASLDDMVLGR